MISKWFNSNFFLKFLSAIWFLAVAIPIGFMMGQHQVFLNNTKTNVLSEKVSNQNSVLHLIGADCLCSEKVAEHLVKRKPLKTISEKVIVVGSNPSLLKKFKEAGFLTEQINENLAYERYAIKALPQMIIFDSKKIAHYSGGYSNKRSPASEDYDDLRIIAEYAQGKKTEARPIFGCANGSQLRKELDPLKIKYKGTNL